MSVTRIFRFRSLAIVALAVVALSAGFAVAGQNTVASSSAGDGWADISGYDVTSVQYSLNSTNPQNIDSVAFSLSGGEGKPATVKAKLVSSGSTWHDCASASVSAPYAYTCTTTGASVFDADELRVIAAQ
ncbi:MAG TPA: hypothetical protein VMM78_17725 [Thermomicrobiales bacterium]|nr:hypothetical protein [Thermomicrobiales bacterium]